MGVFKRGGVWWYRFQWNNTDIRESTKQGNKRVAEQMEAKRRADLAMGLVGIRKAKAPTLKQFLQERFLPWVRTQNRRPATVVSYELQVRILLEYRPWIETPINAITPEQLQGFIERRQSEGKAVTTINRSLSLLKRALHLAEEWEVIHRQPLRVRLLAGEASRDRILEPEEERTYLDAALQMAHEQMDRYRAELALWQRGKRKARPVVPDARLMHDIAVVLLDTGLRPNELYRLRWEQVSPEDIRILEGKGKGSRRVVPLTVRAAGVLEARRAESMSPWVFPAATATGHTNQGSAHQLHERVIERSGLEHFPLYTFRHTALTRLAPLVAAFDLQKFAGHRSLTTTQKYVHLADVAHLERIRAAQEVAGSRHKNRHNEKNGPFELSRNVV
jgi:integrase